MKSQKRKWLLLCAALMILFCLTGCGAKISTVLDVDDEFSGERIITCVVSKSDAEDNFEGGIDGVDEVIAEHCPENLISEKTDEGSQVIYTFILQFESFEDYKAQIDELLGRTTEIEFRQPDSVFSSGLSLQEDFDSRDVLGWFKAVVEEEDLMSNISNLWELSSTKVNYNGEEIFTGGMIYFDRIESNPVEEITLVTVASKDNVNRTISFIMPYETRDSKREEVDAYMAALIPADSTGNWLNQENGYCYEITMSAASMDELVPKMETVFGESYEYIYLGEDNDPFITLHNVKETFEVYEFGDASYGAVEVNYIYRCEGSENLQLQANGYNNWAEYNEYQYEEYTGTVNTDILIKDISKAEDLNVSVTLNKLGKFDAVVDIVFPSGEVVRAEKAASYYGQLWEDVTTEVVCENGEVCRIELLADNCAVVDRMNDLFETDYSQLDVLEDKGFFKSTYSLEASFYFANLAHRAGIADETVDFVLDLPGYKLQELCLDGTTIEEAAGENKYSIEDAYDPYIYATVTRTNAGGIIVLLALLVVALGIAAFAFISYVKKMAQKDGKQDESFVVLAKAYLVPVCIIVKDWIISTAVVAKDFVKTTFIVLKDLFDSYYPESANKKLMDYFYGSRWPLIIVLLCDVILPVAWMIIGGLARVIFARAYGVLRFIVTVNRIIDVIQMLGILVAIVWYVVDRLKANPDAEREYDKIFEENLNYFESTRGLEKLGLVSEQVAVVEPLQITGPDYEMLDTRLGILFSLLRFIKRLFVYDARLVVKQGSDGKIRYSCLAQNVWYYSENQMYRYKIGYDLSSNEIHKESTSETFYQDLTKVASESVRIKVTKGFQKITKLYQSFDVVTASGNVLSATVDSDVVSEKKVNDTIKAMQNLVREKKEACAEKMNRRRNKL